LGRPRPFRSDYLMGRIDVSAATASPAPGGPVASQPAESNQAPNGLDAPSSQPAPLPKRTPAGRPAEPAPRWPADPGVSGMRSVWEPAARSEPNPAASPAEPAPAQPSPAPHMQSQQPSAAGQSTDALPRRQPMTHLAAQLRRDGVSQPAPEQ